MGLGPGSSGSYRVFLLFFCFVLLGFNGLRRTGMEEETENERPSRVPLHSFGPDSERKTHKKKTPKKKEMKKKHGSRKKRNAIIINETKAIGKMFFFKKAADDRREGKRRGGPIISSFFIRMFLITLFRSYWLARSMAGQ